MLIKVNDGDELRKLELKEAVEKNYFKEIYLQELLVKNDVDNLNIYYKIKYLEFKNCPNLILSLESGNTYLSVKETRSTVLTEKEVKDIIEPIFILWEYRLTSKQFDIWYKSLKLFNKRALTYKVNSICQRCVFKPKLGDFYR